MNSSARSLHCGWNDRSFAGRIFAGGGELVAEGLVVEAVEEPLGEGALALLEFGVMAEGREKGVEALHVHGGDLQGVEHEGGGLVVERAGLDAADDVHEGELDGGGVLDEGEPAAGGEGADVEAAERLALERRGAAAGAVELDVGAAAGGLGGGESVGGVGEARVRVGHRVSPPPGGGVWNQ